MKQNSNKLSALAMENVEALADETSAPNESEREKTCKDVGNYWNMALVNVEGGVGNQSCTISGEINNIGANY